MPPVLVIAMLAASDALAAGAGIEGTVLINDTPAGGAVVYLMPEHGAPPSAPMTVTILQEGFQFQPRFSVVTAGSTVRFENHDNKMHNIHSKSKANRFDLGAHMPGAVKTVVLAHPGPVGLACSIHPKMKGLIYVSPSPYFSVTDPKGHFTISDAPPGAYRAEVWHRRLSRVERARGARPVTVGAGEHAVRLELSAAAPEDADLSESAERDWVVVAQKIHASVEHAVDLWAAGNQTAATTRIMLTHFKLFHESGFYLAIRQRFGHVRADGYDERFDALRKRVQTMDATPANRAAVHKEADALVGDLAEAADRIGKS